MDHELKHILFPLLERVVTALEKNAAAANEQTRILRAAIGSQAFAAVAPDVTDAELVEAARAAPPPPPGSVVIPIEMARAPAMRRASIQVYDPTVAGGLREATDAELRAMEARDGVGLYGAPPAG